MCDDCKRRRDEKKSKIRLCCKCDALNKPGQVYAQHRNRIKAKWNYRIKQANKAAAAAEGAVNELKAQIAKATGDKKTALEGQLPASVQALQSAKKEAAARLRELKTELEVLQKSKESLKEQEAEDSDSDIDENEDSREHEAPRNQAGPAKKRQMVKKASQAQARPDLIHADALDQGYQANQGIEDDIGVQLTSIAPTTPVFTRTPEVLNLGFWFEPDSYPEGPLGWQQPCRPLPPGMRPTARPDVMLTQPAFTKCLAGMDSCHEDNLCLRCQNPDPATT